MISSTVKHASTRTTTNAKGNASMSMRITPELSKSVGWQQKHITWPTMEEVEAADDYHLLLWYRHLPSAPDDKHGRIMSRIMERFQTKDEMYAA